MDEKEQDLARQIGRRIIEARREMSMSQEDLGELIHVSPRSMQAYESGETIPYRKLSDLAAVLNRPAAWILHGDRMSDPIGSLGVLEDISSKIDKIVSLLENRAA